MHSQIILELERDMIPVIQAMEQRGLNVNLVRLKDLITETTQKKQAIESKLKVVLGITGTCNFNSSADVSDILSDKLGIKPKRTRTGRLSTERRMLKEINNPVTDEIVLFRELEKFLSALNAIYKATDKVKGKIFCSYLNTCPSGRLYTHNYSFQSIPEAARCVIYPDEGCTFILADYDSFELRLISALAHDKYFKGCWEQGLDLHRKVISDMQNVPYSAVTDKQRRLGKALNFGISYLQEPAGLARNLHISIIEAEKLMRTYKQNIPDIERLKLEVIKKARLSGFTETFHGRKRLLPNINSPKSYDRRKSERQAVNTCIQGSGADIVKFSLLNLHRAGYNIDTMLHDGILLTIPDNEVDQSLKHVREIMEVEIEGMKFPVTCKTGKTWGDCYRK
ncbi:MAG: DNA polymerase A family protein [Candidatus Omnitrophota bacterium]